MNKSSMVSLIVNLMGLVVFVCLGYFKAFVFLGFFVCLGIVSYFVPKVLMCFYLSNFLFLSLKFVQTFDLIVFFSLCMFIFIFFFLNWFLSLFKKNPFILVLMKLVLMVVFLLAVEYDKGLVFIFGWLKSCCGCNNPGDIDFSDKNPNQPNRPPSSKNLAALVVTQQPGSESFKNKESGLVRVAKCHNFQDYGTSSKSLHSSLSEKNREFKVYQNNYHFRRSPIFEVGTSKDSGTSNY